jgi:hypothetical protein
MKPEIKIAQFYEAIEEVIQLQKSFDNDTLKNIAYVCCSLYNKFTSNDIDVLDYMALQLKCVLEDTNSDELV